MPRAKTFRDDDVQRMAQCFCVGKAKDPSCSAIPSANYTFHVRIDDRLGHAGNQTVRKMLQVVLHTLPRCLSISSMPLAVLPLLRLLRLFLVDLAGLRALFAL